MQLSTKQTREAAQFHILEGAICIDFPVMLRADKRTYGRTESDKISGIDRPPNFLAHGAPRARLRCVELR